MTSHHPYLAAPPRVNEPLDAPAAAVEIASGHPLLGMAIIGLWIAAGVAVAVVGGRRGHPAGALVGLGVVLGPLLAALLWDHARHRQPGIQPVVVEPGDDPAPGVDVLVVLADPDGGAAALGLVNGLAPRIGRVTLGRAIDYDAAERAAGPGGWGQAAGDGRMADDIPAAARHAALELRCWALAFEPRQPRLVLLPGCLADAVDRQVREGAFDLVVVGLSDGNHMAGRRLLRQAPPAASPLVVVRGPGADRGEAAPLGPDRGRP